MLVAKLRGHYAYYGVKGNSTSLSRFLWFVERSWRRWLGRRSQRGYLSWDRFKAMQRVYPLPAPRIRPGVVT